MTFFLVIAIMALAVSLIASLLFCWCRHHLSGMKYAGFEVIGLLIVLRYTLPISVGSALLYAFLSSNIPLLIICLIGLMIFGLGELWLKT